MNYVPIFNSDARLIALATTMMVIIAIIIFVSIFHQKIKWLKFLNRKWINSIAFLFGFIIGFVVAGCNRFAIFDEDNNELGWVRNAIYLSASFTNLAISIMFTGFLIFMPFKFLTNLYLFSTYKKPLKKFTKITGFYAWFGLLAIGVALLMYPLAPTFFKYSSDFSFHATPLLGDPDHVKPTLYVIGNYMLIKFFKIKTIEFSFYFLIYLILTLVISYLIIKLFVKFKPSKLHTFMDKVTKISDKSTDILTIISSIFTFTAITVSLMVQTIGTFLRISLIIILMIILTLVILLFNYLCAISTRSINSKHFFLNVKKASMQIAKSSLNDDLMKQLSDGRSFRGFKDFNKEQNIYNIFLTSIFPLIIVAYLGFSAGPLYIDRYYVNGENGYYLKHGFELWKHILFWISLYIYGYFLTFAYAFRYNDVSPYKIILSASVPWIRSGYNTGILNYFNNFINKLAVFSTYTTFLAIACKHEKHYRKFIL